MGRIILTIAGPWNKPPVLKSPLELHLAPPDPDLAADLLRLSATEAMSPSQLEALIQHRVVLQAEVEFEEPGARRWAQEAVRLARDAFLKGALGILVEPGMVALVPDSLGGLRPQDPTSLFHLMVGIYKEETRVITEGMQAFDLPEIQVLFNSGQQAAAQGAAFSLSARMVCDHFHPVDGGFFRASESAPLYRVERLEGVLDVDDELSNPRGAWRLHHA